MKILSYGSMNIDHVYLLDHINEVAETQSATSLGQFSGGKGLNQSVAIAKSGGTIYHAGIVGDDGDILIDTLRQNGVNVKFVKQVEGASAHTIIQIDKHGQNSIIVYSGANMRLEESDIDSILAKFNSGDYLVLQNELYNSPLIMRKAAAKGLIIVFNPSPMNSEISHYPLSNVSWFIMNEVEAAALTGETQPIQIINFMKNKYPKSSTLLTLGAEGAYCHHLGKTYYQPAFPVKVVDTTAAGDTFSGYFISQLSIGKSIEDAMKLSARAAAITVSRKGASDSIPTIESL